MDWGQSYSASWRVFRVNRSTWADAEQITNVDSVDLTRTADGSLLESGNMDVTGDFTDDYYRIVMTAEQGGEVTRVEVATMLCISSSGNYDYGTDKKDINGYSVLYPASVTLMHMGDYAPAGVDAAAYVGDMLAKAINAPVEVEGSFTLNEHVVFDVGMSVLDGAWAVLDACDYVMQIDGRGVVHIMPKPKTPIFVIDSTQMQIFENGIEYRADYSNIPNRYIVISGVKTIVTNDDPNSIVSTVNRGYYVDKIDESPTPVNGETMGAYASRMLSAESITVDEYTYTREYVPDINLYDIVRASISGMEGDLRVVSQSVSCGHGISIKEKANKEVQLWQ